MALRTTQQPCLTRSQRFESMPEDRARQTIAATNGIATDRPFGAVAPPLYLSSTFAFASFEKARDYDYTRTANPSRAMLADTIARLESGAGGVVVSSGMAAVDLVLSRLRSDDLIVAPHDCYAGTWRLLAAGQGAVRCCFRRPGR
jgi:cystathionine gamma-synthase